MTDKRIDAPEWLPETVTCPSSPRHDGDIVGCGKTFTQQPDEEGIFDCPHCGIFFNRESLTG